MILSIPTINDRLHHFKVLYKLYAACLETDGPVTIEFSGCDFLRQNAVAFLCGLIEWLTRRGRDVKVHWHTCQPLVLRNLQRNGFSEYLGHIHYQHGHNAIPVRQYTSVNQEEAVVHYLLSDWLGRGWVKLSDELAGAIIGNVWEIFANSFEHSQSESGLFVCGQHYPNGHELALSVADFGVGIPGKVRRHLKAPEMDAIEAFRWALQRGNSTRVGKPGGLGLDMLKEFISVNKGEMAVYSREGYFRWFGDKEQFGSMPSDFRGTIVNLTLKCDGREYCLG